MGSTPLCVVRVVQQLPRLDPFRNTIHLHICGKIDDRFGTPEEHIEPAKRRWTEDSQTRDGPAGLSRRPRYCFGSNDAKRARCANRIPCKIAATSRLISWALHVVSAASRVSSLSASSG
jgi:hypothetical protein